MCYHFIKSCTVNFTLLEVKMPLATLLKLHERFIDIYGNSTIAKIVYDFRVFIFESL